MTRCCHSESRRSLTRSSQIACRQAAERDAGDLAHPARSAWRRRQSAGRCPVRRRVDRRLPGRWLMTPVSEMVGGTRPSSQLRSRTSTRRSSAEKPSDNDVELLQQPASRAVFTSRRDAVACCRDLPPSGVLSIEQLALVGFGHPIVAQTQSHPLRMRHRLDTVGIDLLHLPDELEYVVEFGLDRSEPRRR